MARKSMVWFIGIRGRAANAAARWLNGFSSRVRDIYITLPLYRGNIYIIYIKSRAREERPSSFFTLPSSLFVLPSSLFTSLSFPFFFHVFRKKVWRNKK